jgi:tetratricopeptide (TPR) repeat protein
LLIVVGVLGCRATNDSGPGSQVPHPAVESMPPELQHETRLARERLDRALVAAVPNEPALADAYGRLGMLYQAHGFTAAAAAAFGQAERHDPDQPRWPYYSSFALGERGDVPGAIGALERAAVLAPDYLPLQLRLARLELGRNETERAGELFAAVVAADPRSAAGWVGLGKTALARGDHALAIEHLERARELAPDATEVNYPLGLAYRGAGDPDAARAALALRGRVPAPLEDPWLEQMAALASGAAAGLSRGSALLQQGRPAEAAVALRASLNDEPNNAELRAQLGLALAMQGETDAARRELGEAIRLSPVDPFPHFNLAVLEARSGNEQAAVRSYENVLRHDPDHLQARYQLGNALYRLGRFRNSAERYAEVVERAPTHGAARYGEAVSLIRLEEYREARLRLESGLATLPRERALLHALVRILAAAPQDRLRDGPRAMRLADRLAAGPLEIDLLPTMAMVAAENGMFDEATQIQQRAIRESRQAGRHELLPQLEAILREYEEGKPCRRPWLDGDPLLTPVGAVEGP